MACRYYSSACSGAIPLLWPWHDEAGKACAAAAANKHKNGRGISCRARLILELHFTPSDKDDVFRLRSP
jgi:hypothetical protein